MQRLERVYSIAEVEKTLNLKRHKIVRYINDKKIPTPIRCGDSYVLTDLDVSMLRVVIEAQGDKWRRKAKVNQNNEVAK